MPKFSSHGPRRQSTQGADSGIKATVKHLETALAAKPEVLLVLGSGLGDFASSMKDTRTIPYDGVPFFKQATAPGHAGKFVLGTISGKQVLAMQGRYHVYEGYTPQEVAYPVQVAAKLGVGKVLISCACGGINEGYSVGDLVLVTDYINFTHAGPLAGPGPSEFGSRFVDMSSVFDRQMKKAAKDAAKAVKVSLKEGVYFYMPGPQFETPAEIRAMKSLGADLVGMSLVHEAVMARHCGMKTLAVGLVTNLASGISKKLLSEKDVLAAGKKALGDFGKLIEKVLESI